MPRLSDTSLRVGGSPVQSIRRGSDLIWQPGSAAGPVTHVATQRFNLSNTSTTVSNIQSGDLIVVTSTQNIAQGAHPTVSGFTILSTWDGGAEIYLSMRQQWGLATASTFTLPAWGNGMQGEEGVISVFRKAAIGAFAVSNVGVVQFPALTLVGPIGQSMVVCTAAAGSWHGVNVAPSGYTDLQQLRPACISRSNGYVTSRSAENFSGFGASRGSSLEIIPG